MSWALSLPVQTLKDSSARHVLLCLANYAGSNGTGAFPSASTLAQDTGLSERTVRYKLDDLEKSGLIQKGNQAIQPLMHLHQHHGIKLRQDGAQAFVLKGGGHHRQDIIAQGKGPGLAC